MNKNQSIHIIGGGIIGLTSAWYLMDGGYDVTIIDKTNLTDGTSHGNAGMIVPSHFVPMAAPGVIIQGMKWMFDSKSPFFIKPRMSLDLLQWLWKFYRNCNARHVEKCVPILLKFNRWSKELYKEFSQDVRFSFCFEEKGLLMLYRTKHQQQEEIELAEKANLLGLEANVLNGSELNGLEPEIDLDVLGGVYFKEDAHLYPNKFIHQLKKELANRGARFVVNSEVVDFVESGRGVTGLIMANGNQIDVRNVLVSGGAWTPFLLKKLGVNLLLQDGKGYSFTLEKPLLKPNIPTILAEAKVAVTPMGDDLRIGGTLELGGMSKRINQSRLKGIMTSIPKYYPELKIREGDMKTIWMGYRPCSADGMPFIGRSAKMDNLIIATGHGMMGMSMGPATGKLVSEIAIGKKPSIDLSLMSINR